MTDETTTQGEARDYALIFEDGTEQVGSDLRPLTAIVAELARARNMVTDKDVTTWKDPILQGDEDGNGIVHYFEPLRIKGVKTPAASDLDDDEDDLFDGDQPVEVTPEGEGGLFKFPPASSPA